MQCKQGRVTSAVPLNLSSQFLLPSSTSSVLAVLCADVDQAVGPAGRRLRTQAHTAQPRQAAAAGAAAAGSSMAPPLNLHSLQEHDLPDELVRRGAGLQAVLPARDGEQQRTRPRQAASAAASARWGRLGVGGSRAEQSGWLAAAQLAHHCSLPVSASKMPYCRRGTGSMGVRQA